MLSLLQAVLITAVGRFGNREPWILGAGVTGAYLHDGGMLRPVRFLTDLRPFNSDPRSRP